MSKLDLPAEVIHAELEAKRVKFEGGNQAILLSAIRFCGDQKIVMPEWLVDAFAKVTNRWYSYKCKTLDEAFGIAWPKGKQFAAAQKKARYALAIFLDVEQQRSMRRPVNAELFREVGKRHGLSKTVAEEYYRAARAQTGAIGSPGAQMLLEPFVTDDARLARATRKVTKLSVTRSKQRG